MTHVIETIAPIFLIIGFGAFLKARSAFADEFWRGVEKLTFNLLFPSLLFIKIAGSSVDWETALPVAAAVIGGVLLTGSVAVPFKALPGLGLDKFVSMFQGGFRPNTYVGIAVIFGIMGDGAVGPLSVTLLVLAITINMAGAWGHLYWLNPAGTGSGLRGIAADSIRNPLIVACLLGLAFNVAGLGLPPVVAPTLDLISRASLPLGLMAVGASLSLRQMRGDAVPVTVAVICKLAVQPLITYAICRAIGLEGAALAVPVIFAGLPTSSTAYVVSRRMGSHAELSAAIVTATHLFAIVSIPVMVTLLH